jgi:hypothetical protein
MGCGKRALCRKQQAPPIALLRCKSPSKECLRPSLSIRPSSLPKHLKNVGGEEEVSTKDPQEFSHSGGRVIHAIEATLKKGEWDDTPLQSRQRCMSYTLSQLLWVLLTGSIDMETREDPRNHWNLPVDVGTLSCRVSMMYLEVHMRKQRPLVSIHNCGRNTMAVSRYPVLCLKKTAPTNHKLGSPRWIYAVIL